MKTDTVTDYGLAIQAGDVKKINATFSTAIEIYAPGSLTATKGKSAAMMLSTAAAVIDNFRVVRIYLADDDSYAVAFKGSLAGAEIQIIDEVLMDDFGKIRRVNVFMRPTTLAGRLLEKVTEEMMTRSSAETD